MKLTSYVEKAMRTKCPGADWTNAVLGLIGEIGEVADLVKKAEYHGKLVNCQLYREELGDVLWYYALAVSFLGKDTAKEALLLAPVDDGDVVFHIMALVDLASKLFLGTEDTVWEYSVANLLRYIPGHVEKLADGLAGYTIEQVMDANIKKLEGRYPCGFTGTTEGLPGQ